MPTSRRMPYDTNKLDELTKLFEVNGAKVVFGGNVQADGEFLDSEGHPIKETTSYISLPNGASSGTLEQTAIDIISTNKDARLILDNEIYVLQDNQISSGYIIFSHVGQDSTNNFFIKCIAVTLSTKGWVKTTKAIEGGGGGKVYSHNINIEYSNGDIYEFIFYSSNNTEINNYNKLISAIYNIVVTGNYPVFFNNKPSSVFYADDEEIIYRNTENDIIEMPKENIESFGDNIVEL